MHGYCEAANEPHYKNQVYHRMNQSMSYTFTYYKNKKKKMRDLYMQLVCYQSTKEVKCKTGSLHVRPSTHLTI